MKSNEKIDQESSSTMEKKILVTKYLRDSHNPYPGKLIEAKVVKIKDRPFARSDFDLMMDAKDERNIKTAAETAEEFEVLVDSAMEGGYQ